MKNIKKIELLKAMRQILKEYENKTHTLQESECSLCLVYRFNSWLCNFGCNCPMAQAFGDYGCTKRHCRGVDCRRIKSGEYTENELNAVIEFYKRAIEMIEQTPTKMLNIIGKNVDPNDPQSIATGKIDSFIASLRAIDLEVAEKYGVKKLTK